MTLDERIEKFLLDNYFPREREHCREAVIFSLKLVEEEHKRLLEELRAKPNMGTSPELIVAEAWLLTAAKSIRKMIGKK